MAPKGAYIRQFREFFAEVTALRRLILAKETAEEVVEAAAMPLALGPILEPEELAVAAQGGGAAAAVALPKRSGGHRGDNPLVAEAQQKLLALLEGQALAAEARAGAFGKSFYREAQFVMAALADEVFVSLSWSGSGQWQRTLLETRLFGSYGAGHEFFKRLDTLLEEEEPAYVELAYIYLLALSLGFRGKHRSREAAKMLDEYRVRLHAFVFGTAAEGPVLPKRVSAAAYECTRVQKQVALLPSPLRWFALLAAVASVFLIGQHVLWDSMTEELELLLRLAG
jgi:type VI secretion system protein ImpK